MHHSSSFKSYNKFFAAICAELEECEVTTVGIIPNDKDPTIVIDSESGLVKAIEFNFSKGKSKPNIILCRDGCSHKMKHNFIGTHESLKFAHSF